MGPVCELLPPGSDEDPVKDALREVVDTPKGVLREVMDKLENALVEIVYTPDGPKTAPGPYSGRSTYQKS